VDLQVAAEEKVDQILVMELLEPPIQEEAAAVEEKTPARPKKAAQEVPES
jgi:hypothetical protein